MATTTVQDGGDADAFVEYLNAATSEINYAAADLYKATPPPLPLNQQPKDAAGEPLPAAAATSIDPCGIRPDTQTAECAGYYANFEADTPLLEARIIRLMVAALPEAQARDFLKDAAHGNILGSALKAIHVVVSTTSGLHRAAGTYRTGLEIIASQMKPDCFKPDNAIQTVSEAVPCTGLSKDKLFASSDRGAAVHVTVQQDAFRALMAIARTSCAQLRLDSNASIQDQMNKRNKACDNIRFSPTARPTQKS